MSLLVGLRIELWVEERGGQAAINPVMVDLLAGLARSGARVKARVIEHETVDPARPCRADLILLRSATDLALAAAMAAAAAGVRVIEAPGLACRTLDKAAVIGLLAAHNLPVPPTYLVGGSGDSEAVEVPSEWAARSWFRKPVRGVHGWGVSTHESLAGAFVAPDHAGVPDWVTDDGCRLVQAAVGEGPDLKIYAAGEKLFAGRKGFHSRSYADDSIDRIELDPSTAELARTVGAALGLRLYGLDLRLERGRAWIVDVNPFPGYRGFPDAAAAIEREIIRALAAA